MGVWEGPGTEKEAQQRAFTFKRCYLYQQVLMLRGSRNKRGRTKVIKGVEQKL